MDTQRGDGMLMQGSFNWIETGFAYIFQKMHLRFTYNSSIPAL